MKKQIKMFADGYMYVYEYNQSKSTFKAALNVTSLSDLKSVGKLAFDEMSKRQQDVLFAESDSRSLSLKVRTRLKEGYCNKKYCVVINGTLYDVITIDDDRAEQLAYWYLEEVRAIAG